MGAPDRAPPRAWLLVAIAFVAVAVRTGLWLQVHEQPAFAMPVLDSRFYVEEGKRLAGREESGSAKLPVDVASRPFFMSPGYTAFVAACARVARDPQTGVVALQIVLDAASCVLVAALAWRRVGAIAGAAAGLLLALHGAQIVFATRVLDATLGAFLVALLAVALDRLDRDVRPARFAAIGLLLGAIALLRATVLLFVPVALAWIAWRGRREGIAPIARRAGALLVGLALPIAPVTIRNLVVSGEPVLLTSSGGVNFLIGNFPGSDGRFATLNVVLRAPGVPLGPGEFDDDPAGGAFEETTRRFASRELGHPVSAREASRFYAAIAWSAIAADPGAWLALLARKAFLFADWFEVPQVDNLYFLARSVGWLEPLAQSSRWLWPLALFGLLVAGCAMPPLLRAFFVTHALAIVLFFVTDRYRLWVTPFAAFAAVAGVARLVDVMRRGSAAAKVVHGAAFVGIGLFGNLNPALFDPVAREHGLDPDGWFAASPRYLDFRAQHNNLAARLLDAGDAPAALAECEAGLALAPDDPALRFNLRRTLEALGSTRYRAGDFEGARAIAEKWARALPRDPEAWNLLGAAQLKLGATDAGLAALARAIELAPADPKYPRNLAIGLVRAGRHAEAIPLLDRALAAQPNDVALQLDRAEAALATGDEDRARDLAERALKRDPTLRRARDLLDRAR